MKSLRTVLFVIFYLLIIQQVFSQRIDQETIGSQSPAIVAEAIRLNYGIPANVTLELIKVYEMEGTTPDKRNTAVIALIEKYRALSIKKEELTKEQKSKLGILAKEEISNILNYDIFISTKGYQSPAIYAPGGYAEIWYGISPIAFRGIWEILEDKQVALEEFDDKLKEQVDKFKALEKELNTRANYDEIAAQAKLLLDQGDIDGAEMTLLRDFHQLKKTTAYRAYQIGIIKELKFELDSAAFYMAEAINLDEKNSEYLSFYADILYRKSEFGKAINYLKKSLAIELETFGELHENTSVRYNNLGVVYYAKGDTNQAIKNLGSALEIDKKLFGDSTIHMARNYNNLAGILAGQKDFDGAITLYGASYFIIENYYNDNHPFLGTLYANLGSLFMQKQEFNIALRYFHQAMISDTLHFGRVHPNLVELYSKVGDAYYFLDKYEDSKRFYQYSLEVREYIYGANSMEVSKTYKDLGNTFKQLGKYDQAIKYYAQAIEIDSVLSGKMNSEVANTYNNLGLVNYYKKDYKKSH